MPLEHALLAESWVHRHEDELTAAGLVVAALAVAYLVDRGLAQRGRVELGAEAGTRLRFLRRLLGLGILLFGLFLAVGQFAGLNRLVASALASGALAAAVVGFAARQTLANVVAGVMLALTQPLRIGDVVEIEGEAGTVEDVRLNYSILRTPDGHRLFIPNERLAAGVLRNETIVDPRVVAEAEFAAPPAADSERVLAALGRALPEARLEVVEITHEGIRVRARGERVPGGEEAAVESEMRRAGLRELHADGLLQGEG